MDPDTDDLVRHEELETLKAIFPEISHPEADNPYVFELELPVEPAHPLTVTFPPLAFGAAPPGPDLLGPEQQQQQQQQLEHDAPQRQPDEDSLQITHLPSLNLRITLPRGYPRDEPPCVSLSTNPPWLSPEIIGKLQDDGPRLWEEAGRDQVAYAYIDHVQRATDDVFGTVDSDGTLQLDPQHKLAVLDYDLKAKTIAFGKKTFECGVCLDPKKGSACHQMLDCGHVFCLQCLRDFYNDAIASGSVETVRCVTPNCAKDRTESRAKGKARKARKVMVNPSELLQIGLSEDMVKRYVSLKYKMELEADKNTIYCPRRWCNGAARSKTHKKPSGLDVADDAPDSDSDTEGGQEGGEDAPDHADKSPEDLVAICEDCSFAFCSRCFQSWHGTFFRCRPKNLSEQLTEEEKASLDYINKYTSPCPTCGASTQKSFGCNHMLCSRCHTHFCYLCSAWLEPGNPYKHYNQERSGCYMRLWELEEGDGELPQARPNAVPWRAHDGPEPDFARELDEFDDDEEELVILGGDHGWDNVNRPDNDNANNRRLDERGQPVAVAREAPLVLRLVNEQHDDARGGAQPIPPPAPDAPQLMNRGGQNQNAPQRVQHQQQPGEAPRGGGGRGRGRGVGHGHLGARAGRARGVRGRGGRGGGRGGGGGGPGHGHQHNDNVNVNINNLRRNEPAAQPAEGLDAAQQEWVRRFVQMALIDAEDQMEGGDSDEEGGNWLIP